MKTKIRKVFSLFLGATLMMLACGCTPKPSRPVRSAALREGVTLVNDDSIPYSSGTEADVNVIKQFTGYHALEKYTPEKSELRIIVEGKECTVKYSSSNIDRPASPVITDEYYGKTADGKKISVTFARGNTSKVIGYRIDLDEYSNMSLDDEDGNKLSEMKKLPQKDLVELAQKAAYKYTDIGYYNNYYIEYMEGSSPYDCGWYAIAFYASVNGVRAADHAIVLIYPDGQVWSVISQPTLGIAKNVSDKLDAAACDAYAEERFTEIYSKTDASFEYVSHELYGRKLVLDDDGKPMILYTYKVKLNTDKGGSLFNTVTDFATVGVWLG